MAEKRKRRSREARGRIAEHWLSSGLTASAYAAKHGVTSGSLARWARELRDEGGVSGRGAGFVEVPSAAARGESVRVVAGAVTLQLDRLPPAEYVAALGRALC